MKREPYTTYSTQMNTENEFNFYLMSKQKIHKQRQHFQMDAKNQH